jgi:Na+/H+-dicarboxylate symporter/ABC-type amino acid transport substrate-binding protein
VVKRKKQNPGKGRKISLAAKIMIGVVLGIFAGIFFGELVKPLSIIGDVFILLLQMPVLPYVFVSLIAGIGSFNIKQGGHMAINLVIFMIILWAITLITVIVLPLTFPDWESASFFSSSQVEEAAPVNFLELYIPANPFHALSNSIVPAVVLFSIILGVALSMHPQKENVIRVLTPIADALSKVTNWIVGLAPIGVFALVAGLSGTIDPELLSKIGVFLWGYSAMALFLGFWMLPGLLPALTPIRYREIMTASKDALVTAFATGNLFVVLPMLAERSKFLLKNHDKENDEAVDVIVPTAFSFPSSGKILTLSFILFAGWFSGFDVPLKQYPTFLMAGTISFFGSTITAIPFMLDLMHIPSDLINLFLPIDNIITNRFGVLVACLFVIDLTLLVSAAEVGLLKFRIMKIIRYTLVSLILLMITVLGLRLFLGSKEMPYTKDQELVKLFISRKPVQNKVFLESVPPATYHANLTRLENIHQRGYIRVGFLKDHLPSAFINQSGDPVGSDIEMAHTLARDLGVSVEFVRIERMEVARYIKQGDIDILMTGVALSTQNVKGLAFTEPYRTQHVAFLVRDYNRHRFSDMSAILKMDSLRIGITKNPYYESKLHELLPNAEVVTLESPRIFFRQNDEKIDALAATAEAGGAWTIIYPEFSVVVPDNIRLTVPLAYIVPGEDQDFLNFINTWIILKKSDGSFDSAFDYWEKGFGIAEQKGPRWSVIRNALKWID